MFTKANPGRDAFAFSLQGLKSTASYAPHTVISDERINRAIAERIDGRLENQPATTTRDIEDFLARYFAPGSSRAA